MTGAAAIAEVSARMAARAKAVTAQKVWREQRAQADKRREAWGLDVAIAIGERDEVVAVCGRRAGAGLRKLVDDGLSLDEAVQWAGGTLTVKEARELLAVACPTSVADAERTTEASQ